MSFMASCFHQVPYIVIFFFLVSRLIFIFCTFGSMLYTQVQISFLYIVYKTKCSKYTTFCFKLEVDAIPYTRKRNGCVIEYLSDTHNKSLISLLKQVIRSKSLDYAVYQPSSITMTFHLIISLYWKKKKLLIRHVEPNFRFLIDHLD